MTFPSRDWKKQEKNKNTQTVLLKTSNNNPPIIFHYSKRDVPLSPSLMIVDFASWTQAHEWLRGHVVETVLYGVNQPEGWETELLLPLPPQSEEIMFFHWMKDKAPRCRDADTTRGYELPMVLPLVARDKFRAQGAKL